MTTDKIKSRFSKNDLCTALRKAGVQEGDCIVSHCSLFDFGFPDLKGENLCHFYLDAYFKVAGESGILVLPAFSYTFCKGENFDPFTTKSEVNALANYCIDNGLGIRTLDPIFSYIMVTLHDLRVYESSNNIESTSTKHFSCLDDDAGVGVRANSNYSQLRSLSFTNDCLRYDKPSIAGFLLERNAKYLMLGSVNHISLLHSIELKMDSPYRFYKKFSGKVLTKANDWENYDSYYYVRCFVDNTVVNLNTLSSQIDSWLQEPQFVNCSNQVSLGNSRITFASLSVMLSRLEQAFSENWLWLCKGPALSEQELKQVRQDALDPSQLHIKTYPVIDLNYKLRA